MSIKIEVSGETLPELLKGLNVVSTALGAATVDADPVDDDDTKVTKSRKSTKATKATNNSSDSKPVDGKAAEQRDKALELCRELYEDNATGARKDLKALAKEFEVEKLSQVPIAAAAELLKKAEALHEKYSGV
jgi:hypothetical protein